MICCWLFLRINVDLAIFQPYLDLEAGDNQSLKIQVARPGIEPRSSCSASQELNHSATAAPKDDMCKKEESLPGLKSCTTLYQHWPYYSISWGFPRTFATGAACQWRTLTPSDSRFCPIRDLQMFYWWNQSLLNFSCLQTLNFEHPLVLLIYLTHLMQRP